MLTVQGIYKDGKIELTERPSGVGNEARVLVTFLTDEGTGQPPNEAQSAEEARREAGRRLLARMEKGIHFGGPPYPKREELHDRVYRFDTRRDG
jgi:hypothetical protein